MKKARAKCGPKMKKRRPIKPLSTCGNIPSRNANISSLIEAADKNFHPLLMRPFSLPRNKRLSETIREFHPRSARTLGFHKKKINNYDGCFRTA